MNMDITVVEDPEGGGFVGVAALSFDDGPRAAVQGSVELHDRGTTRADVVARLERRVARLSDALDAA